VLKTVDSGATWTTANKGLPTVNVYALAIDPATPSTVYAGTDAGVFKSIDGGQRWAAANTGLGGALTIGVNTLAIAFGSPATLYAARQGGIFKTTDGAANWTSINAGLLGTPGVIAIDPNSPSTIYIDDWDALGYGVFKSIDAGASWTRIYTTPTDEYGVRTPVAAIAIDPHSPSRLYLLLAFPDPELVAYTALLTSVDGGASWSSVNLPLDDPPWRLAIDPASGTLYAGTYSGAILRTTDAGDHWTPVSEGPLAATSINVIAMTASAPATIYAGGAIGIFRSPDHGETWTHLAIGVRNVGVSLLAVDPIAPSTMYTTVGGILMKTTDGGDRWADSALGISGRVVDSLAIDPASPSTLYTGTGSANPVYKSTDAGAHWVAVSNGLPDFGGVQALAIAPAQPSTLYVGEPHAGVWKSIDGGSSWTWVNDGLIDPESISGHGFFVSALAVDPTSADIVYAASERPAIIVKSTDGAAQWREVPIPLPTGPFTFITSLAIDPAATSTIYAAYADLTSAYCGVLKSNDRGESWTASQNVPTSFILALAIDPSSPSQIYAATGTGVFSSTDASASWTRFNFGLPSGVVRSISIDRTGSLLRAATETGLFEYQITQQGNHTGLWWAAPPGSESGWGIHFAHQGDTILATWLTFGLDGKPLWLVVAATKAAPNVYAGTLYTASGPAFNSVPFDPTKVLGTSVGTATFTFAGDDDATFAYTVNGEPQTKPITREQFSTPMPTCTWGTQEDLALATNFQGLWWGAPAGVESGWGINFAHQGDTIVATWFTFGSDGDPLWLAVVAYKTAAGVYSGDLFTATGPALNAVPFDSSTVVGTTVGRATFTFADGNHASFDYTINEVAQTKQITRQVFAPPGTICQ